MSPLTRREFLFAAGAVAPLVGCPGLAQGIAAAQLAADWRIAFADVDNDLPITPMRRVSGAPPGDFRGRLYRNGPGKFRRPGGAATHWFDGDGLVRVFGVDGGQATLAARFVDTAKRRTDTAAAAVVTGGFGTTPGPATEVASADAVNAANTSLVMRGGELWALWEAGSPTGVDPATLATRGVKTLRPDLEHMPFLAHPRVETGGRLWNLGLAGDRAVVWQIGPSGDLQAATPIELPRASYIHDFTATDRHIIIVLQPWVRRDGPATPVTESMQWRPELGTQILVLDKADLSHRRVYELPAFFFFHLGDAWEERDGTLCFDVCRYPDASFATDAARQVLEGVYRETPSATLARISLDPRGRARLDDTGVAAEFPRSDARRTGAPRSLTVHVAHRAAGSILFQGIGVQDWAGERSRSFDFGRGHVVEEMVFVPRPGDARESSGWIVGPTINLREAATELHVFDAGHVDRGPLCTWRAPLALPVGFHGLFVS